MTQSEKERSDEGRSDMENAVLGLYLHAAQRIKAGATYDEIERELIEMGLKPDTAQTLLARLDESRGNVARRSGYRNALVGAVAAVGALSLAFGAFGPVDHVIVQAVLFAILLTGVYWLVRGIMQIVGL